MFQHRSAYSTSILSVRRISLLKLDLATFGKDTTEDRAVEVDIMALELE